MISYSWTIWERPWSLNAERRGAGGHGHWSVTRTETSRWREWFAWSSIGQRGMFQSAHVEVRVVMRSPLMDTGNYYGSVKAAIDGLVDSRVLPGDGPQHVLSILMHAPTKAPSNVKDHLTITLRGEPHE